MNSLSSENEDNVWLSFCQSCAVIQFQSFGEPGIIVNANESESQSEINHPFPSGFVDVVLRPSDTLERLLLLRKHFDLGTIEEDHQVEPNQYYLVAPSDDESYFVFTDAPAIQNGQVLWRFVHDQSRAKSIPLTTLLRKGKERKITWLRPKLTTKVPQVESSPTGCIQPDSNMDQQKGESRVEDSPLASTGDVMVDDNTASLPGNLTLAERDTILDTGAFSQLVEAAQRSGIVPGIATILQVRDCEFRLGKYQLALQIMESMFASFSGAASQRAQRLLREDADIAAGKIKMSPRELQAKRVRDNLATDAIDRARNRFMRVIDGLRLLIHRVDSFNNHGNELDS